MIEKLLKNKSIMLPLLNKINDYKKEIPEKSFFKQLLSGILFGSINIIFPVWLTTNFVIGFYCNFFDNGISVVLSVFTALLFIIIFTCTSYSLISYKESKLIKNKSALFVRLIHIFGFNLFTYNFKIFEEKIEKFIENLTEEEKKCLENHKSDYFDLDNILSSDLKEYLFNEKNKESISQNKEFFEELLNKRKEIKTKEFNSDDQIKKENIAKELNLINDLIISLNNSKENKENLNNVILSKDKKVAINKI